MTPDLGVFGRYEAEMIAHLSAPRWCESRYRDNPLPGGTARFCGQRAAVAGLFAGDDCGCGSAWVQLCTDCAAASKCCRPHLLPLVERTSYELVGPR